MVFMWKAWKRTVDKSLGFISMNRNFRQLEQTSIVYAGEQLAVKGLNIVRVIIVLLIV